ncbi:MAG: hypothetical protein ACRDKG_01670 [Actinomycetota bacterium]
MNTRQIALGASILVIALLGTGVAVSREGSSDASKDKAEQLEATFLERLAGELGTSTDRLKKALAAAGTKTIDDAVKAGLLTGEQAAKLKERIASGMFDHGFGFGRLKDKGRGSSGKAFGHERWAALGALLRDEDARTALGGAIAKTLGMSTAELRTAITDDGKDIAELMKAKDVTEEALGAAVAAAATPHLDRLVKTGTIERADADEILERMAEGAWIAKLAHLSRLIGK